MQCPVKALLRSMYDMQTHDEAWRSIWKGYHAAADWPPGLNQQSTSQEVLCPLCDMQACNFDVQGCAGREAVLSQS